MTRLPTRAPWLPILIAASALWSAPRPALAQVAQPDPAVEQAQLLMQEARRLFEAFQYETAIPTFDRIVTTLGKPASQAGIELLAQALELRARAHFATGNTAATETDLAQLLAARPEHTLPAGVSPRIVKLFDTVKTRTVGQLVLTLTPPGEIDIDGRRYTVGAKPIDLAAGEHTLKAARPGYRSVSQPFTIVAGQPATLAVAMERVSATLTIATAPAGVEVLIDGVARGATPKGDGPDLSGPLLIGDLAPGPHRLQLRRDCYGTIDRQITIERPEDVAIEPVRMPPAVAAVNIETSEPGAIIFLDGRERGPAPAELNAVCEGFHAIEVRSRRGRFIDRRQWRTGDKGTLKASLRPAFALVGATGVEGPAAVELQRSAERAITDARSVLVYTPAEGELEAALREENATDWVGFDHSSLTREARREMGLKLTARLQSQGVAWVAPAQGDPNSLVLSLLASGSGEPDRFMFRPSDQESRAAALAALGSAPLSFLRSSIQTVVVDLAGVPGAAVIRAPAVGAGARAGLAPGDVVVGAGGQPVASVAELNARIALAKANENFALEVRGRDGATRAVTVAVSELPGTIPMRDRTLLYNKVLLEIQDAVRIAKTPVAQGAARLNLAIVHMRLQNWDDARLEFEQIKLPDGPGVSAGTVAYLLGLTYEALGRTADAETAFTRAAAAQESTLSDEGPLVRSLAQQKLKPTRP